MPAGPAPRRSSQAAPARGATGSPSCSAVAIPAAEPASLKLPETPVRADFGNASSAVDIPADKPPVESQLSAGIALTTPVAGGEADSVAVAGGPLSCQAGSSRGNIAQVESLPGLEAEIDQFLATRGGNLSRPPLRTRVFDDFARGRLVTLLGIGLSQRQAAAALGVSHTAVQGELARRPELVEEVSSARFQAQVEPLLVILRESRRSWRAATWLVNYLTRQINVREETPDEALVRAREEQLARRDQQRADEKDRREYERKLREREEQRELNRKRAETRIRLGGPSPKERRECEEEQRKIKELFAQLEAEADAAGAE